MTSLRGRRVLIVGGGSGIGREIASRAVADGADVVIAGRHPEKVEVSAGIRAIALDLTDESSIERAAADLGAIDAIVALAADHANGPLVTLDVDRVRRALDAKVVGPILLAKHFAPTMPEDGAIVLFSGVAASRPSRDLVVMATGNRAAEGLADALAVELAPIRVVAVSPGIIDSGAWDTMGAEQKSRFFASTAAANPARRIGSPQDVTDVVMLALTNPFLTATTIHIDGGGRLA
ncbi:SDR family oxidoreductase [Herbiconiux moechotypicola]|uniref:SDR family oxidoreductase n=1 Tax=Herbiconiux moechotypicola TaxID=637393 RepID=A0ABP5R0P8_9MICO|nr:SDR family oxidoreductase [Herbiconiux moechotypicola]MCS5731347.1 SDR family oxidoreductase [Herbiconiux moechotypicola]